MTKQTLSNKSRISIVRLLGFRSKMTTANGKKIIKNRRKKKRKKLTLAN